LKNGFWGENWSFTSFKSGGTHGEFFGYNLKGKFKNSLKAFLLSAGIISSNLKIKNQRLKMQSKD